MAQLVESVEVAAPPQRLWDTLVDWDRQGEWMVLTRVRGTAQDGQGVGGGVEARTGIGPVGFLDTMEVRVWEPPRRCVVRHTGRVVRGAGAFEISDLGDGRCRFTWSEWLQLPFGVVGQLGWPFVRPLARRGLRVSLRRFARRVESGG